MIVHEAANRVVRLRIGAEECALRIPRLDEKQLQIDRRSECAALQTAAAAALAPMVMACDPESGVTITRWIDAPVWTAADAGKSEHLQAIAGLLRRLHSLAPPPGLRALDVGALMRGYWDTLLQSDARLAEELSPLHTGALALPDDDECAEARLCHNDLHCGNIIGGGAALRLLDWEYAALGQPLFDLASYAQSNDLDAQQKSTFLEAYGAQVSTERFARYCRRFDWVCALWLAVSGQHRTEFGRARFQLLLQRSRAE